MGAALSYPSGLHKSFENSRIKKLDESEENQYEPLPDITSLSISSTVIGNGTSKVIPKSVTSSTSTSVDEKKSYSSESCSKDSIVTYPPCLPKNPVLIQSSEILLTPKQSTNSSSDNIKTASPRPPKNTNMMVNSWDSNYDTLAPLPPNVFHKKG